MTNHLYISIKSVYNIKVLREVREARTGRGTGREGGARESWRVSSLDHSWTTRGSNEGDDCIFGYAHQLFSSTASSSFTIRPHSYCNTSTTTGMNYIPLRFSSSMTQRPHQTLTPTTYYTLFTTLSIYQIQ